MSKFTKTYKWKFGRSVDFLGYRKTGIWGMYCRQRRCHQFGIYGIIALIYTIEWGYDY